MADAEYYCCVCKATSTAATEPSATGLICIECGAIESNGATLLTPHFQSRLVQYKGHYKNNKFDYNDNNEAKRKRLSLMYLYRLCGQLNLNNNVRSFTQQCCLMLDNYCERLYSNCKYFQLVIGCVLYCVDRLNDNSNNIDIIRLSNVMQINPYHLWPIINQIKLHINLKFSPIHCENLMESYWTNLQAVITTPKNSTLNLMRTIRAQSSQLILLAKSNWLEQGRHIRNICAACIHLAAKGNSIELVQNQLQAVFPTVCLASMRQRELELLHICQQLAAKLPLMLMDQHNKIKINQFEKEHLTFVMKNLTFLIKLNKKSLKPKQIEEKLILSSGTAELPAQSESFVAPPSFQRLEQLRSHRIRLISDCIKQITAQNSSVEFNWHGVNKLQFDLAAENDPINRLESADSAEIDLIKELLRRNSPISGLIYYSQAELAVNAENNAAKEEESELDERDWEELLRGEEESAIVNDLHEHLDRKAAKNVEHKGFRPPAKRHKTNRIETRNIRQQQQQ
jgi:transcription initiation factor TFIIIB Brf1 subunit/transcription initiation factor TFIIB